MDFPSVAKRMHNLLELGVPGCAITIRQDHKELYRYVCGVTDTKEPMVGDEAFFMFSCSKPITVAAVMQLAERGLLNIDDPVSKYLPEFADVRVLEDGRLVPPKTTMLVRHLLTMSAGLDYNRNAEPLVEVERRLGNKMTTRDYVAAMAKKPLLFHPGERFKYSLCHDVLGAVIEVASGKLFGDWLQDEIFAPLGMTKTSFTFEKEGRKPVQRQWECLQETGEVVDIGFEHPYFYMQGKYQSGGGGLVSTLDDYALFADAMACGGVGATGKRIIKEETIALINQNQMGTFVKDPTFSCATGPGYGYGLGVRTLIDKSQGQRSPLGEFGWDGANGAFVIIDPVNRLSFSFVQHMRNWPRLMGEFYAPIRDEVYEALGL